MKPDAETLRFAKIHETLFEAAGTNVTTVTNEQLIAALQKVARTSPVDLGATSLMEVRALHMVAEAIEDELCARLGLEAAKAISL